MAEYCEKSGAFFTISDTEVEVSCCKRKNHQKNNKSCKKQIVNLQSIADEYPGVEVADLDLIISDIVREVTLEDSFKIFTLKDLKSYKNTDTGKIRGVKFAGHHEGFIKLGTFSNYEDMSEGSIKVDPFILQLDGWVEGDNTRNMVLGGFNNVSILDAGVGTNNNFEKLTLSCWLEDCVGGQVCISQNPVVDCKGKTFQSLARLGLTGNAFKSFSDMGFEVLGDQQLESLSLQAEYQDAFDICTVGDVERRLVKDMSKLLVCGNTFNGDEISYADDTGCAATHLRVYPFSDDGKTGENVYNWMTSQCADGLQA
jgi:hypothetical protein